MADKKIKGLGVALITPFNKNLEVDFEAIDKIIDHIIYGGADYIVVLGTTAEAPTLSQKEKSDISYYVREKTGERVPLVIGIGGNNTAAVVEDILNRDLYGFDAVLSVAPFYNKPTQEGLFRHYKAICDNSPLPVILYNVPGRTGVNITAETTIRLASYSNKISGIKEASGNLEQCQKIIKNTNSEFNLISGDDAATCDLMQMGASGVISVLANAYPKMVKKLVTLCKEKKFEEAKGYQKSLRNLIGYMFEEGNPAGVKFLLSKMGLIENILRLPLVPVSKSLEEKLEKESKELLSE